MDQARREKLLARLKKCLALSASPEPHEAAAALRQAQAMMKELGVTESDLEALEMTDALVKTREGFGACRTMSYLVGMLCKAFGVEAVNERNPGSAGRLNVRYIGPRDRVLLAEYSHRVVWRAMQSAWDGHLEKFPHLKGNGGQRQAFHIGWLVSVNDKVQEFAKTDRETTAIQAWKDKRYGELETVHHKKKSLSAGAFHAGKAAGADFQLNRPVSEQRIGIGYKGEKK